MAAGTITTDGPGLKLLLGTTQGDDNFIISKRSRTVVAGKVHTAVCRFSLEDADKDGFWFGFWTAADAEIAQAEPADGIYFESGATVATLIGTVRTASGTSRDTGTLATLSDSVGGLTNTVELAVQFCPGATAAASWGAWWVNGTRTGFTADQLTALGVMGAAADAVLGAGIGSSAGDTGADDVYIQYAWAGVDR